MLSNRFVNWLVDQQNARSLILSPWLSVQIVNKEQLKRRIL